MKTCRTCGEPKELSAYYKHLQMADGHLNICKDCTRKRVAKHRVNNPELYAQRDRDRYETNPGRRKYCNDAAIRAKKDYPLHRAARVAVGNAVRDRRLIKKPCEVCGKAKSEAHHDDYAKPLDVRWLCRRHHMDQHRKYDFVLGQ